MMAYKNNIKANYYIIVLQQQLLLCQKSDILFTHVYA